MKTFTIDTGRCRFLVETATLAVAVIGSGKGVVEGESRMKKTYQINEQRATQRFRKEAGASNEKLQLALPLPEVLALVQRGLMSLALAAFTKLAEEMMRWEVTRLAGPKHQANESLEKRPLGIEAWVLRRGRTEGSAAASSRARRAPPRSAAWQLQHAARSVVDGGLCVAQNHARTNYATLWRSSPRVRASVWNREIDSK
jgi:hypothetical protein